MKKLLCAVLFFALPATAAAQQRPLVTEDPEAVGQGQVLIEFGFDRIWAQRYPASGLQGTLLRLPTVGLSIGVGIAEIQIDTAIYQRLTILNRFDAPLAHMLELTDQTRTVSIDDVVVGTKVRLMTESPGRPSIGVRFATKLPNASNERGLGLDTIDFFASLLVAKTVDSVRVVANAGVGILSDATRGDRQDDVLTYGLSSAWAFTQGAELVGEINGRVHTSALEPAPGAKSSAIMRTGVRYTRGSVRVDAGALIGVLAEDPKFGITAGVTWVFNAFRP